LWLIKERIQFVIKLSSVARQYLCIHFSRLLEKHQAGGNEKALAPITSTSPVAWRHVHLNGRYGFREGGHAIDPDSIVQGLDLG